MRIIIIEDEIKTAKELQDILERLDSSIEVDAVLSSVAAGIRWLKSNPVPELIFSDIQLGDGLSFEIFREVQIEVPVIFCTAFDVYAIQAFESNSIDYLLKPIEDEMVERSLRKYMGLKKHLLATTNYTQNFKNTLSELDPTYKQHLLVHYRDKIIPVKTMDIHFVYATGGSVSLHLNEEVRYVVQYTIEQLENMLDPHLFFRANRQFIINRHAIKGVEHYFNRKLYVITQLPTPEKMIIGKVKSPLFLKWMGK